MNSLQIQAAQAATRTFTAALEVGVNEDLLIESLFEEKIKHDKKRRLLECISRLFEDDSKNFMDICQTHEEK